MRNIIIRPTTDLKRPTFLVVYVPHDDDEVALSRESTREKARAALLEFQRLPERKWEDLLDRLEEDDDDDDFDRDDDSPDEEPQEDDSWPRPLTDAERIFGAGFDPYEDLHIELAEELDRDQMDADKD